MKFFRSRIGLALLVTALLVAAFLRFRAIIGPTIRRTHTNFLFQQLDQFYQRAVTSGQQRARSSQIAIASIGDQARTSVVRSGSLVRAGP
jgi:hypothetical protein